MGHRAGDCGEDAVLAGGVERAHQRARLADGRGEGAREVGAVQADGPAERLVELAVLLHEALQALGEAAGPRVDVLGDGRFDAPVQVARACGHALLEELEDAVALLPHGLAVDLAARVLERDEPDAERGVRVELPRPPLRDGMQEPERLRVLDHELEAERLERSVVVRDGLERRGGGCVRRDLLPVTFGAARSRRNAP